MRPVTVYSRAFCGHCTRAVQLLAGKGAEVNVIDATFDSGAREEMAVKAGRTTYPQIFVGDTHIGGFDDLRALEDSGRLDAMLEEGL
jgi:glutaredoxin 3